MTAQQRTSNAEREIESHQSDTQRMGTIFSRGKFLSISMCRSTGRALRCSAGTGEPVGLGTTGTLPALRGGESFSVALGAAHEFITGYSDVSRTAIVHRWQRQAHHE
jgi:hypothetical protein